MTFFKVDDGLIMHPKFATLSPEAVTTWLFAGTWCGRYLTDGHVPTGMLYAMRGNESTADELVTAGLWEVTEDGWYFHDWCEYQYTKDQVEKKRESDKRRKQKQRGIHTDDEQVSRRDSSRPSRNISGEGEGEGEGRGSLINKDAKFSDFWETYPRKVGKQAALKAFRAALSKATADEIIAGAERFRDDPNREDQYTAHPTTWLNQGRWEDEALPSRGGPVSNRERGLREADRLIAEAQEREAIWGRREITA